MKPRPVSLTFSVSVIMRSCCSWKHLYMICLLVKHWLVLFIGLLQKFQVHQLEISYSTKLFYVRDGSHLAPYVSAAISMLASSSLFTRFSQKV
ncbi:hypothetical protein ACS0TY_000226 [Phlomoides rotata]